MALTPIDSPPITVVISLTDHRGRTEAAVSAWNRQTYPRELITLYLLYDGRRPAFADDNIVVFINNPLG